MHASFIVSTPEGWGYLKYINRRNLILYKTYIHKATPDDLENIPIQIYHYFCTMSPTSLHLQQMSIATLLLVLQNEMYGHHTTDNFKFKT